MQPRRATNIAAERLSLLRRELHDLKATAQGPARTDDHTVSDRWEHVDQLLSQAAEEHLAAIDRLARLSTLQQRFDDRLVSIENSLVFRLLRATGGYVNAIRARTGQILLRSRLHKYYQRVLTPAYDPAYRLWSQREETRLLQRYAHIANAGPRISVLMPVYNPTKDWLGAAIQSVRRQMFANWQLCICDDCSTATWVADYLNEHARSDSRITVCRAAEHGGISRALNLAAGSAAGEYLAFLDHDDVLPAYALSAVAEVINSSSADVIYSDEDRLDPSGERTDPIFKPDWSPNLLLSCMYAGHLVVVARDCFERVGRFRPECDGSQDHDLLLRLTDSHANVKHIPHILYHWRKHSQSTSVSPSAKRYTQRAGRTAVQDALDRRGWSSVANDGPQPNTYRLRTRLNARPMVSIIICTRTLSLLRRCLTALQRRTDYQHREIIIVQHLTGHDDALSAFIDRSHCVRIPYNGAYNSSLMNNAGSEAARGEILLFLNDDIVPLRPDWLDIIVEDCARPGVGVVGAKLRYPSGTIQHAGIVLGISDGCGHIGRSSCASKYWPWLDHTRDVSAVTGACLAISASVFREIGGFRDIFATNYGDVDLCLRVRDRGLSVIIDPEMRLQHSECGTRVGGTNYLEREAWYSQWHFDDSYEDEYFNPNLARREQIALRLGE